MVQYYCQVSEKFGKHVIDITRPSVYVFTRPLKLTNTCVRGGSQERDSARTGRCRFACAVRVHAYVARTRETGGVPIYNGDIIADYLRFRVDSRKFLIAEGRGADLGHFTKYPS